MTPPRACKKSQRHSKILCLTLLQLLPDPYWVEAADGGRLACYYQAVRPDAKTVVYFHRNGAVVAGYPPDFPDRIARARCNCLLAEYRGYGMSTGAPALIGMLKDVVPMSLENEGNPSC